MKNFEQIAETPEALAAFLAALPVADGPWDAEFRRVFCAACSAETRLGVEALELKVKGLSGTDIARLYHTTPNNVGAWISRAAQKIRKDFALRG